MATKSKSTFVLASLLTSADEVLVSKQGNPAYFRVYLNSEVVAPAVGTEIVLQSTGEIQPSKDGRFKGVTFSRRQEAVRYAKLSKQQAVKAWEYLVTIGDQFYTSLPPGALKSQKAKNGKEYFFARFVVIEPKDIYHLTREEWFASQE